MSVVRPRLRRWILERDDFTCQYCGTTHPPTYDGILHVDHVIPRARGGSDDVDNLVTACARCNLSKSGKPNPAYEHENWWNA